MNDIHIEGTMAYRMARRRAIGACILNIGIGWGLATSVYLVLGWL